LKRKIVLITGATSGIGRETALGLADLGATIIFTTRNISLFTRNINCSIKRVDGEKITQIGIEPMESCIIDPKQEVCIETEILIPYFEYLKAGN
jgi:NAD(P)-dependent dehydrogenase (short-subunit alcohol dehydrogenase family)